MNTSGSISSATPSRAVWTLAEWLGGLATIAVIFALFRCDVRAGMFSILLLALYTALRSIPVNLVIGGWALVAGLALLAAMGPPSFGYRHHELFTTLVLRLDAALESWTATALSVGELGPIRKLDRSETTIIRRGLMAMAVLAGVFSWRDSPAAVLEFVSRFRIAPAMWIAGLGIAGRMAWRCPFDGAFALQLTFLYLFVRAVPGRVRLAGWCLCGLALICEEFVRPSLGLLAFCPHWTTEIEGFLRELVRTPFLTTCEPPGPLRFSTVAPTTVQAFGSFLVASLATAASAVRGRDGSSEAPRRPTSPSPSCPFGWGLSGRR